jgi:hypothetical protein
MVGEYDSGNANDHHAGKEFKQLEAEEVIGSHGTMAVYQSILMNMIATTAITPMMYMAFWFMLTTLYEAV